MASNQTLSCTPRDLLFFRDGRPMDVDKSKEANLRNIGHGAYWPRPDHLHSALMHHLIADPTRPEKQWYGSLPDLRVLGPFPCKNATLYLPFPLDWDMLIERLPEGMTNLPKPLTHGFCDRTPEKKVNPPWITLTDYASYLEGKDKGKTAPAKDTLYLMETRTGTTLDPATGASKRIESRTLSGQYTAEYLRLFPDVTLLCSIRQSKRPINDGENVILGGQGGTITLHTAPIDLEATLHNLPKGTPTRYVRWTLITPALFDEGWYPNWLNECGKIMIPQNEILRRAGESREVFRKRKQAESKFFETAHLIAARIGSAQHFSGWDSEDGIKPTQLIVPAGSSYIFECQDESEAEILIKAINLRPLSDLGEKGFGIGLCSYISIND